MLETIAIILIVLMFVLAIILILVLNNPVESITAQARPPVSVAQLPTFPLREL